MATYEIPLSANAQTFSIQLAQVVYRFTIQWRDAPTINGTGWVLDIADQGGNPIRNGIPLVTGADLLEQHQDLGLGFSLYVQSDDDVTAVPTYDSLGQTSHLYAVF